MVYLILSRDSFDQLAANGLPTTPLWVSGGVLTAEELKVLRSRGHDISDFDSPIGREDAEEITECVDTIRLHHPDQVVWVES